MVYVSWAYFKHSYALDDLLLLVFLALSNLPELSELSETVGKPNLSEVNPAF